MHYRYVFLKNVIDSKGGGMGFKSLKRIVPTILVYKLNNFFINKEVEISLNIN